MCFSRILALFRFVDTVRRLCKPQLGCSALRLSGAVQFSLQALYKDVDRCLLMYIAPGGDRVTSVCWGVAGGSPRCFQGRAESTMHEQVCLHAL